MERIQEIAINSRQKSLIDFALKSRTIACGYEAVKQAIRKGRAAVVLLSPDISENSLKKISSLTEPKNISIFMVRIDENMNLSILTDRYKVIALHEGGIAKGFMQNTEQGN